MRITLITLFYLSIACSGAKLSENKAERFVGNQASKPSTGDESTQDPAADTNDEKNNFASGEIPTAAMPISVGGAYLYCNVTLSGAECRAQDAYQKVVEFVALNAYIVSGNPVVWNKTPFVSTGKGNWTVTLPLDISGSFAVAIENAKGQVVADWVVDSQKPPLTKIADGGFEAVTVDPFGYSYFSAPISNSWSFKLPDTGALCDEARLEVQLSRSFPSGARFPSREGRNFVELNSACGTDPNDEGPNNTIVYQELNTIAGHVYQLRFAAGRTQATVGTSTIGVKVDGKALFEREFTNERWIDFKMLFIATGTKTLLEFQELTPGDDPRGSVLDSVAVYDVGSGALVP